MASRDNAKRISRFIKCPNRLWIPFGVLAILLFTLPSIVSAQIQIHLRVIEASNVGSSIDPSLRDLTEQLGSLFRYTSYRLMKDEKRTLAPNQGTSIPVHEGRSIEIIQVGHQPNMVELRVRIRRDNTDLLNTQVRLSPGRTVLIGGPKHREGVSILALSARF